MIYFLVSPQAGCQILRFRDAVKESTQEAQALAQGGACPPHLKRDPPNSGLRSQSGGSNSGSNSGVGDRSQATCSDTRAVRHEKINIEFLRSSGFSVLYFLREPYLVSTTSVNGIPLFFSIVSTHIAT